MSLRSARRRDFRLIPVAAAAWLAAAVATHVPDAAAATAIAAWAATGALLLVVTRMPRARTALAIAAVAFALAAAVATHVASAYPARSAAAGLEIDGGRALQVDAVVVGKVEPGAAGVRFDAIATAISWGAQTHDGAVPVEVGIAEGAPMLDLGARVRFAATAFPAAPGERAVLVLRGIGTLEVLSPAQGVFAAASDLRHGLRDLVSGLPQPGAGLVAGIAVGDTSAVTDELDADMKTSSLAHLTAVSGANCALVVGIAFGLAAVAGASRGVRVLAGLGTLAGFIVLVSPEPSVVRAGTMAAIAMIGVGLGRIGAGVSVLAVAVCAVLVADPWIASSLGFALSVAATASLLVVSGPLAAGLARWMPQPLALALSVPLAAQLACGPLLIIVDARVPVYGVLANLLAAPAAPAATVLGLAACLLGGVPLLGAGIAHLAWVPAAWVSATASTTAALPGASAPWPEGIGGLLLLAAVGACVVAVIVGPPGSRPRRAGAWTLAAAAALAVALPPVTTVIERGRVPDEWSIVACDVGQGDAVLVRSAGAVALIDTGPEPDPLARCLDRFAIEHIDLLVLSHFDVDHRGGLDAVVGRVGTVLHGPVPGEAADRSAIERLEEAGATALEVTAGVGGTLGDARWRVLWPKARDRVFPPGNDASVVLSIAGDVPASVFLGDLSAAAQRALLASGTVPAGVDVVKVSHHGSGDQEPTLYRRLAAPVALITVGPNDYGHPRASILETLRALGSTVARTDDDGDVAVVPSDGALGVWRARAAGG